MDAVVLAEKLESLRKCVRRLEDKCAATVDELREDIDRQDIVTESDPGSTTLCGHGRSHAVGNGSIASSEHG